MISFTDNSFVFIFSLYIYFCRFQVDSQCFLNLLPFSNEADIVTTTLGPVKGSKACSRDFKLYFQYLGIPYAEPPVGNLRFEPPQQYRRPWTDTRAADKWGSDCLQFDAILLGRILGNEDCLFLNIFTPSVSPEKPYPVLVWIHGGGFTAGGSRMYIPSYFMDTQEIIVVSMNYRLGALGFLNTGDDLVRGNMGLKDQNMALRFVKDNIARFGGDPDKITIFGESSGAASVHYHVISRLSSGLFTRAIMQSGNVFCPWAFTRSPRTQALRFGGIVGCPNRTTDELVNCLKSTEGRYLVSKHSVLLSPVSRQDDLFAGSVEMGQRRDDTFLAENPFTMLARGDFNRVPVIFGINSGEGALKTARLEATPNLLKDLLNFQVWNENVPILLHYNKFFTNVSDIIFNHYFPELPRGRRISSNDTLQPFDSNSDFEFSKKALQNITEMISDGVWFHATELAARNHSQFAPVYLNYFSYTSKNFLLPSAYSCLQYASIRNIPEAFFWVSCVARGIDRESSIGNIFGACHTDDMIYYWALGHNPQIRPIFPNAYDFSRDLVTTISNFVKQVETLSFRHVRWERVQADGRPLQYMRLDRKGEMISHPNQAGIDFIKSIRIWNPFNPSND